MDRNILIEELTHTPIEQQTVEFVERKGIGHPDSIADGLAESVSRALSQMYIERYGRILHHNTDETQIVGGQSAPKFGGGSILEPIYILLVGRATTNVNGERLPYRTVAMKAAYSYLEKTCKNLDVQWDVVLDCMIGQGSVDLTGLYETQRLLANDTSFGVGFAPFSETERMTLDTERYINGKLWKKMPEVGEDVKVMACRNGSNIDLTVATAMVSSKIPDKSHYKSVIDELRESIADYASKYTKRNLRVFVNTADDYKKGIYYLTVSGLSMENGDDGSVGRGNRSNGLITPMRPMSMEASAGKNPVTHVGKLYNLLSNRVADEIYKMGKGDILEVHTRILSQIGKPIDQPQAASANMIFAPNVDKRKYQKEAAAIFDERLATIYKLTDEIVAGKVTVF
ncbi:MAG: methionine adenosyltransferase [Thermoplasmata archaeon]|nr:methionine adenosyltransferase [Thermoplasmata archaeon]TFG68087.1 MAG: methionine adenosyltransferase [Methanomassiliicoccus sp.]